MAAVVFIVVVALVFAIVWINLAKNPGPRAKLGPDGTNVREPETFVVHHEGKGQGLDIANTALKKRTERMRRDLPGKADTLRTPVPGRAVVRMDTDMELAAETLPNVDRATHPGNQNLALSRLGQTDPGESDVEDDDDSLTLQPEFTDDLTDLPEGEMPVAETRRGAVAPFPFGEDAVVVMVRNPWSLYVYWERTGHGDENLRAMLGGEWIQSRPCLRVFDVSSGAYPGQPGGQSFVINLAEHDDHWFINEGIQPGRRYVVSYERRTPDGRFYLISHSAPVPTPNGGPIETSLLYQQYGRQPDAGSPTSWR